MYSGDPKTGHSKSGIIRKPDVSVFQISNGRNCPVFKWSISLDRFCILSGIEMIKIEILSHTFELLVFFSNTNETNFN